MAVGFGAKEFVSASVWEAKNHSEVAMGRFLVSRAMQRSMQIVVPEAMDTDSNAGSKYADQTTNFRVLNRLGRFLVTAKQCCSTSGPMVVAWWACECRVHKRTQLDTLQLVGS